MDQTNNRLPGVQWVGGTGDFIRIDGEKCTGCGDCAKVCLAGCFGIEKRKAFVKGLDQCMECASCWYVCEQEAILFSWPKGGTGFKTRFG